MPGGICPRGGQMTENEVRGFIQAFRKGILDTEHDLLRYETWMLTYDERIARQNFERILLGQYRFVRSLLEALNEPA